MRKLTLLIVGFVGYVLGSRAGRERYEQIKSRAQKVANDPRVRQRARQAQDTAREQAPVVRDKMTDAAGSARDSVKDKVSGSSGGEESLSAPAAGIDPRTGTSYPR